MMLPTNGADRDLFEKYRHLVNSSYPSFLAKLGLDRIAIKAEAALITDSSGKTYVDCVGGYGLFNIGHNHPRLIKSLTDQLNKRELLTRPLLTEVQVRLAEALSEIAPGDLTCSFLCNSGSEAIDSALKLARLHTRKKKIITAENSFHGYTFGALSASGIASFKHPFEPLVPEIVQVPYADAEKLAQAISDDTAAVLLEPIQHEAGVFVPPADYLLKVQKICQDRNVIFIIDEIKTGLGKTGWMFACEKFKVTPDILVLGKSLGGGAIPIGALIARKHLWKKFSLSFSMSASSYGGNALACRAALTTIEILKENHLLGECQEKGRLLSEQLRSCCRKYPSVLRDVRGLGLLLGIETANGQKSFDLAKEMVKRGVLMMPAYGNPAVLMVEPPLVITFEQIKALLAAFDEACDVLK
jgi:putrescine aminotransferase